MGKVDLKSGFFVASRNSLFLTISSLIVSSAITPLLFISPTYADNNTAVDQINVTIPISCTLDGTGMDSHTANIMNRDYETEIGSTTLAAYCNDNNGFSIYAIGYSNDTYGTTDLIGVNTEELIPTGTTLDGTTSNWAMKLSTVLDPTPTYPITIENSFNNYHAVPSTYTLVATRDSSTDVSTSAIGSVLTTTYAASVSASQVADTYVGKVRYTLVHPDNNIPHDGPMTCTAGKICYSPNSNNYEGTMGEQTAGNDGTTITLLASNFSRRGYGFAGWSDVYDYNTNQNAKFYGPQEDINIPEGTSTDGFTLYAVWIESEGYLQDQAIVSSLCGTGVNALTTAPTDGTATLSSVSALTDQRDNNTYAIAKLADGKCWMIENLRLDNTATLTLANTNNPLNDGTNVTLKHNYTDINTYNTLSATSSVAYDTDTAPDGWCTNINAACYNQSRLRTDNTANRVTNPTTNSGSMYSYGNYYNWYSATAGNGTYSFGANNDSVAGDLCPSNWQLPLGNTSTGNIEQGANEATNRVGGFSYLDRKMGGTGGFQSTTEASLRWLKYPVNYLYSGYVYDASLDNRGISGAYWSSTTRNSAGAFDLVIYNSGVSSGAYNNYKYYGRTLRCIASN